MDKLSVVAILIDPKTDGGKPLRCELTNVGSHIQLECKGDNGFIIQVLVQDVLTVINNDLHG